jgi:hypothetical protein
MRTTFSLLLVAVLPLAGIGCERSLTTAPELASAPSEEGTLRAAMPPGGRPGSTGVVFVTSQGLYYDTFVAKDPLPMHGPFQLLADGETEFGPGDPGYLGGRWWEDLNGDGIQDAGDHYFLCPLLPPGRTTP